jgi:amino acid adenylation domain-containing protein
LRTTFASVGGTPVQVVGREKSVPLPLIDLSKFADPTAEANRRTREISGRAFDLSTDLMLRATLFRLGTQEHSLLIVVHHIAFDYWSVEIFFHELSALYEEFHSGKADSLPELPVQYTDFAEWQRETVEGPALEKELSYWRRKLAGAPASLDLPGDYPRPAAQSFRGAIESLLLPPDLSVSLLKIGRQQKATLFMTLLTGFAALLHRYTGQEDFIVGSPVAGRDRDELQGLIGFFVNSLVLRCDISGDPSFRELLGRVRSTAVEAYDHKNIPFEKLVEELKPERDLSRNPIFQVMFALQNTPRQNLQVPNLTLGRYKVETGQAKLDLFMSVEENPEGLRIWAEYSTDIFRADTIQRMLGHFKTFLEAAAADPDQAVSLLALLNPDEEHRVLTVWNETQADYPQDLCFHQLFEMHASRSPEKVAVVYGDQSLTYSELNRDANQLAHYLQECGVGSESLVAICLERSLQVLVAMLGVLKAGAAYVPLDPAYPKERVDFVLEDAGIAAVLTQQSLLDQVREPGRRLICLETDWNTISRQNDSNPQPQGGPERLAYVIYTSGSTGKPKGVQIGHHALTNFLTSMGERPGITSADILLAVTTISFDIAGLELFLPLTAGARVVIASREEAADPAELLSRMLQCGATMMQATPATWRMLLDAGWEGSPQLKVLCGGEALTGELANQLRRKSASLWNMYGPTETTIWSAVYQVQTEQTGVVPIGQPIANTQLFVLDSKLQPVPIGVPGDLYIGGDGLARGYLNRPELTQEKFLPSPFSHSTGSRLYRTGDRARYLADGAVDFLGRADYQVKIRGFRIELGEIEAVLRTVPGVRDAVVVAHEDGHRDKRLVAYVVAAQETGLDERELRAALQLKLPEYMVPSIFVPLPELPLTPNGKVDRRALPEPTYVSSESRKNFVAPRDEVEMEIAELWQTLLERKPIGIYDNFFELGGHSLLATQFLARLRSTFQVQVSLRSFFGDPTVSGIAKAIEEVLLGESDVDAPSHGVSKENYV